MARQFKLGGSLYRELQSKDPLPVDHHHHICNCLFRTNSRCSSCVRLEKREGTTTYWTHDLEVSSSSCSSELFHPWNSRPIPISHIIELCPFTVLVFVHNYESNLAARFLNSLHPWTTADAKLYLKYRGFKSRYFGRVVILHLKRFRSEPAFSHEPHISYKNRLMCIHSPSVRIRYYIKRRRRITAPNKPHLQQIP